MTDFTDKRKPERMYSYRTARAEASSDESAHEPCPVLDDAISPALRSGESGHAHRFIEGFYPAEETGARWMSRSGVVLIDVPAHAKFFFIEGYLSGGLFAHGAVTLAIDVERNRLGDIPLSGPGPFSRTLELNDDFIHKPRRRVLFTVTSSHALIPSQVDASSSDVRELSIIVKAIGVADAARALRESGGAVDAAQPYHPYFAGTCTVCGTETKFPLENPTLVRESLVCDHCRASNRTRQLARGLLKHLRTRGLTATTVRDLSEELADQDVLIYDTDSNSPLSRLLRRRKQYVTSNYLAGVPSGTQLGERHYCQDLSRLSFADHSFDVVLSSDVLEHVRLYREALRHVYRVLKPGGAFIFTVPFLSELQEHETYIEVVDPADPVKDRALRPRVYHGDTLQNSGSLLYRIYGTDLFRELEEAGFLVDYERATLPRAGIYDCELFCCLKPSAPEASAFGARAAEAGDLSGCTWLNIEFSSKCNLRCRWCVLDHTKPPVFLSLDHFRNLLLQAASGAFPALERIDLHNGGEALLHPDIDGLLGILAEFRPRFRQPLHVAILSNGTVLRESTLRLLASGDTVDEIRISVDGGTPEAFEEIRRGAKWRTVARNVARIADAVRSANSGVKLGIICMVPRDKAADMTWMDAEFKSVLGLAHHLEIRHPHAWEGTLAGDGVLPPNRALKNKNRLCKFLRSNLVVLADGSVTVCCADLNARGVVGNIARQSLKEIHQGDRRRTMIDLWKAGLFEDIPLCSTCEGYYDTPVDSVDASTPADISAASVASYRRAHELISAGNVAEGIAALEKIAADEPSFALAHNDLGVLSFSRGDKDAALAHYRLAVRHDPGNATFLKNLADLLYVAFGNALEALPIYIDLATRNPEDVEAHLALGHASLAMGDVENAARLYHKVQRLDPGNDQARQALAMIQEQSPSPAEPELCVDAVASLQEFENHAAGLSGQYAERALREAAADQHAPSFTVTARCYVCRREVPLLVKKDAPAGDPAAPPNWREQLVCPGCGMSNRTRAAIHVFEKLFSPAPDARIYLAEQVTPLYRWLSARYRNTVGGEFLGGDAAPGSVNGQGIRHEDLTRLSFPDKSLDFIMAFDVFEHIPDYRGAFRECLRALDDNGTLIFSVPFIKESRTTLVRARRKPDGSIEHLLPPEIHGDPASPGTGLLCYYHFGWELLDELRAAGFGSARAQLYWSGEFGYLGGEHFLFTASRPKTAPELPRGESGSHIAVISVNDRCSLGSRALSSIIRKAGNRASLIFFGEYDTHTYAATASCDLEGKTNYAREEELLMDLLGRIRPDVVGFSFRSISEIIVLDLARKIKARFPDIPVLFGGIGATSNPAECIRFCDYLCEGEADHVIVPFLDRVRAQGTNNPDAFSDVPNLWINKNGAITRTRRVPLVTELDAVPFIDYTPDDKYSINRGALIERDGRYDNEVGAYPLMTSRGCPYTCTYCHNSLVKNLYKGEKYYRRRSVDNVIDELVRVKRENPRLRMISIYDDSFPSKQEWVEEFAEKYRRLVNLPFWCFSYPTYITERTVAALVSCGCNNICMGCQSFSEATLKLYNRRTSPALLREAFAVLKRFNVNVQIDLITRNPLESEEHKRETLRFLLDLPKNTIYNGPASRAWKPSISALTLFPNTEMFDMIKDRIRVTGEFRPVLENEKYEAFWEMLYHLAFHDYLPPADVLDLSYHYDAFSAAHAACTAQNGIAWLNARAQGRRAAPARG